MCGFPPAKRANPIRLVMNLGFPTGSQGASYTHDDVGSLKCISPKVKPLSAVQQSRASRSHFSSASSQLGTMLLS